MLSQIDRRGFVRGRFIFKAELIVVGEGVDNFHLQIAGIAFFPIFAGAGENDASAVLLLERLGGPHHLVEAFYAAVQSVRTVVLGEMVRVTVEGKLAVCYSVAVSTDQCSEVRVV